MRQECAAPPSQPQCVLMLSLFIDGSDFPPRPNNAVSGGPPEEVKCRLEEKSYEWFIFNLLRLNQKSIIYYIRCLRLSAFVSIFAFFRDDFARILPENLESRDWFFVGDA